MIQLLVIACLTISGLAVCAGVLGTYRRSHNMLGHDLDISEDFMMLDQAEEERLKRTGDDVLREALGAPYRAGGEQ